jgi:hypothetical protein
MTLRNVWAIEYTYQGEARSMLMEVGTDFGYSDVESFVHPSIVARGYNLRFLGEVASV